MKRFLRILKISLLSIGGFIVTYVLVMFALSRIRVNGNDDDPKNDIAIYILSNGVHTDIVVPLRNDIADWSQKTKIEHTIAKDSLAQLAAFGWGDRDFYLNTPEWSDLKISTALNAAFYRGTGLMHVTFYHSLLEDDQCKKIMISHDEYRKLVDFINAGFKTDSDGMPIQIQNASYGQNDSFYEAKGKYNLFYTCNSWTNNALKASGQKAALWSLTDSGIFYHYR